MEESFVVLQQGGGGGAASLLGGAPPLQQRFSLDARMATAARVLELASQDTGVDQPLCTDCASEVRLELEAQVEELEAEIAAYAALEARVHAEAEDGRAAGLEDRVFARELERAQRDAAAEEARLRRAEDALAAARARAAAANAAIQTLEGVETRYWHAYNAVMAGLAAAADHRDALQQRVDAAERDVAALRRTNALSAVFRIWSDGPFGTISGLRLGSTRERAVEWAEINAAWGQAVLLLDVLARALGVTLTAARLEPRGSFPRLHDAAGAHDLFGPASKIYYHSPYDRAQVAFLACLHELGTEIDARLGRAAAGAPRGRPPPSVLVYPIEGDRVNGHSIRYALSRDRAWTKALKYMLTDLKYCLKGALEVMDARRRGAAAVALLPREGPGGGGAEGGGR